MEVLGWILVLILASLCAFLGYVIYRVAVNERNRKKYIPKPGDSVYFHNIGSNTISCEIDSIVDDEVIVKMKVSKDVLYPIKNK